MTDTNKLKHKIKESGLKIGYLADELGLSRQGLSYKINDKRDFTVTEMTKLSILLNLSEPEIKSIFLNSM